MSAGEPARGLGLDAGALIAYDRGDARVRALLDEASAHELPVHVVAGVVAQVWRDGARQARLARLLGAREVRIVPLDAETARAVGVVCGRSGHPDVVDAHVVVDAVRHGHHVLTSDPDDLGAVGPTVPLVLV